MIDRLMAGLATIAIGFTIGGMGATLMGVYVFRRRVAVWSMPSMRLAYWFAVLCCFGSAVWLVGWGVL
jgi:hypothetical protein